VRGVLLAVLVTVTLGVVNAAAASAAAVLGADGVSL